MFGAISTIQDSASNTFQSFRTRGDLARAAHLAALGMDGITRLPAVGTLDWCQQAAAGISLIHPKGSVAVTLVRTGQDRSSESAFVPMNSMRPATANHQMANHQMANHEAANHEAANYQSMGVREYSSTNTFKPTLIQSELANEPAKDFSNAEACSGIYPDNYSVAISGIIAAGIAIGGELAVSRQFLSSHVARLAQEVRAHVEGLIGSYIPTQPTLMTDFTQRAVAAFASIQPRAEVVLSAAPLDVGTRDRWIITMLAHAPTTVQPADSGALRAALDAVTDVLSRKAAVALGSDMDQWLSAREQAVLERLILGRNVKEIATEFARSPHTIHDHVKSLHRKLHATSRGELIATALGLIDHRGRVPSRTRASRSA